MAIITLFGPPEPATSKVTGTGRVVNYLPKINQAGVLCWVQRPGLAAAWPWIRATVTIVASDPTAGEPANNGQFTVTLSAVSETDTVISYTVSGSATPGSDYTALSGTVTILAGNTTALIDVSVTDDSEIEEPETVIVTLQIITSGIPGISIGTPNSATVTISSDDAEVEHDCTLQNVWGAPPLGFTAGQVAWVLEADNVLFAQTLTMAYADYPYAKTTVAIYIIGETLINKTIFIDYENESNSAILLTMYGVEDEEDAHIVIPHSTVRTTYTFNSTGFSAIWLNNSVYSDENLPPYGGDTIPNTKSWCYCIAIEDQ